MSALLAHVQETAERRAVADSDFRAALREARRAHSWQEIADAAGMSRGGVRWLALDMRHERGDERR